jgi:hypothetical protein
MICWIWKKLFAKVTTPKAWVWFLENLEVEVNPQENVGHKRSQKQFGVVVDMTILCPLHDHISSQTIERSNILFIVFDVVAISCALASPDFICITDPNSAILEFSYSL